MDEQHQLAVVNPAEQYRVATDVAGVCGEIVKKTAKELGFGNQRRKYVQVEGWMAIATAHGCVASARDVEWLPPTEETAGGFRAIGEVRRLSDGLVIATAEGFVGEDEMTWFGGTKEVWNAQARRMEQKEYEKRADYAIRAMAQTRAISRVCRSAFAHVVVLIDEQLATTPAEEVGYDETNGGSHSQTKAEPRPERSARKQPEPEPEAEDQRNPMEDLPDSWEDVVCTYGRKDGNLRGRKLGELTPSNRRFLHDRFIKLGMKNIQRSDVVMVEGLKLWAKMHPEESENERQ